GTGLLLRGNVASGNLLGFWSRRAGDLLNLACRYGGRVRFEAATTCRFLLEAPPLLSEVGRCGTGHGRPESIELIRKLCGKGSRCNFISSNLNTATLAVVYRSGLERHGMYQGRYG